MASPSPSNTSSKKHVEEEERTTSFGLWGFADDFFKAALRVAPLPRSEAEELRQPISSPAYYLVGHSIELSLKAFLRACDTPLHQLRSKEFGHNLEALLKEAEGKNIRNEVDLDLLDRDMIILLRLIKKRISSTS